MTTIAFRDGVMAADSQATSYDCKFRVTKIQRLPCGGLVGGCGTTSGIVNGQKYLVGGCKGKAPKLRGAMLLIAYADGRVVTVEDNSWAEIEHIGPVSIGSGMQAAMAAMHRFGATALEAVEAAATVDVSTSGPFLEMTIERPAKKRRAKKK